ncbi:DUF2561 family protein [Mycobacterium hubeiense]|uniref:DUF2561 family protein n=1 Tax=Mycobacterium hubeiense TaxID=1867256 RepID=UPI000C7F4ADD|nr:DUF2561 family protein [Mycobacterium sp. QGD 101]
MGYDKLDRILLGACAAVWLAALGAAVAATVALVDLGRGHPETANGTPWLLYTVIGVSVVVIAAAVPLLLRARATADQPPARSAPPRPPRPPRQSAARAFGAFDDPMATRPGYSRPTVSRPAWAFPTDAVDQVWFRCAVVLGIAMGAAIFMIGVATYLMAVDNDTFAWTLYVIVGLVTLGMVAIPVFYLRELHSIVDSAA